MLVKTPQFAAALSFYPPGYRQAWHEHPRPQVSLQLGGYTREWTAQAATENCSTAFCIKPDGLKHADRYGPEGAIFLSISFDERPLWGSVARDSSWRWGATNESAAEFVRDVVLGNRWPEIPARVSKLLSNAAQALVPEHPPPNWLPIACGRLRRNPSVTIGDLSVALGVHRVHFARAFKHYYGVSPTTFRRHSMTSRALLQTLWLGVPAATAACDTGFFDQSHMSHEIRRATGLSLRQLRMLMTGGTAIVP